MSLVRVDQVTSIGKKVSTSVERLAVCAKNALGAVGWVEARKGRGSCKGKSY